MKRSPRQITSVERLPEGYTRVVIADGTVIDMNTFCSAKIHGGRLCHESIQYKVTVSRRTKWSVRRDREIHFVCAGHAMKFMDEAAREGTPPPPLQVVGA
jgi:hypothetical protein